MYAIDIRYKVPKGPSHSRRVRASTRAELLYATANFVVDTPGYTQFFIPKHGRCFAPEPGTWLVFAWQCEDSATMCVTPREIATALDLIGIARVATKHSVLPEARSVMSTPPVFVCDDQLLASRSRSGRNGTIMPLRPVGDLFTE